MVVIIGKEEPNYSKRKGDSFCDVIFEVDGEEFRCHRVLMASNVPYFDTMFCSEFREKSQSKIKLCNTDEVGFRMLVDYVYDGKIEADPDDIDQALSLFSMADYFCMDGLKKTAVEHLKNNLSIDTVFWICNYGIRYKSEKLMDYVSQFMIDNFAIIMNCAEFVDISIDLLKTLIYSDYTNVSKEELIYEAVDRWINFDPENRSQYMKELAKGIRFKFIDQSYLDTHINITKTALSKLIKPMIFGGGNYRRRRNRMYIFGSIFDGDMEYVEELANQGLYASRKNAAYFNGDRFEKVTSMRQYLPNNIHHKAISSNGVIYKFSYSQYNVRSFFQYFNEERECWVDLREPIESAPVYDMAASDNNIIYVNTASYGTRGTSSCKLYYYIKYTGTWYTLPERSLPFNRINASSLVTFNNMLYVIGGLANGNHSVNVVLMYDHRSGKWESKCPMPKKRAYGAAAVLNGKIYYTGGTDRFNMSTHAHSFRSMFRYYPEADKWHPSKPMIYARNAHNLLNYRGKLWAIDGKHSEPESYDYVINKWSVGPKINRYRDSSIAAVVL